MTRDKVIREARVAGPCANAGAAKRGVKWANLCQITIKAGDYYEEGDLDPYKAGGFGHERYCMSCSQQGLS